MREHSDIKIYTSAGWKSLKTAQVYTSAGWKTFGCGSTGCAVYAMGDWNRIQAETYTISYFLNSGTNAADAPRSYTADDLPLTLPRPTRSGYTFDGWWTSSLLGERITTIPAGSTGNKIFYARWTATLQDPIPLSVAFSIANQIKIGRVVGGGSGSQYGEFGVRVDMEDINGYGAWGVNNSDVLLGDLNGLLLVNTLSTSITLTFAIRFVLPSDIMPYTLANSTELKYKLQVVGDQEIAGVAVLSQGGALGNPPVLLFNIPVDISSLPSTGGSVVIQIFGSQNQDLMFKVV